MNKSFLTTAALVLAGTVAANANWIDGTYTQDTDTVKYEYVSQETKTPTLNNFAYDGHDSTGVGTEVKLALPGTVDFGKDARYEIKFELNFTGYTSGNTPASGVICLVNDQDNVSLLFGNGGNAMGRLGCKLNEDVTNSQGIQNLVNTALGIQVWTTQYGTTMNYYTNGRFEYTLIFETFESEEFDDMIHFGVKDKTTGQESYFSMSSIHLPCGGQKSQVFDDIDFLLVGAEQSANNGNGKVTLNTKSQGSVVTTFNSWTRTAETIPEPSAFGLIAGMGALALVASRRRRK